MLFYDLASKLTQGYIQCSVFYSYCETMFCVSSLKLLGRNERIANHSPEVSHPDSFKTAYFSLPPF